MKIMITGGCGFIGHHLVEHFLKNTDNEIIILDSLTYASNGLNRVKDIDAFDDERVSFFSADITRPISDGVLHECRNINYILHLAAETHVDNSIVDPLKFVYSNVIGTCNLLNFALKCNNLEAFVYFSTDEVFGPASKFVEYKEWDRYNSTNPYSATKAGAEELVLSYMNTYSLPGFITHCMNVFGERQHPEKFIPLCIKKILNSEIIQIHGSSNCQESGSRFYIHARNVASAIDFLLQNFETRDKYNIVGEKEITNLELASMIAGILDKRLLYEIIDFHSCRPGHDLRYALDGRKLRDMGFEIPVTIEGSLKKTINWFIENPNWL